MNNRLIISLLLAIAGIMSANAQYYSSIAAPNALNFMPGPPDFQDSRFSVDISQYFYGKDVQKYDPVRSAQILYDVMYHQDSTALRYSRIVGFPIKSSTMLNTFTLIRNAHTTLGYGKSRVTNKYLRIRPCVKFNESAYSKESLKYTYSYPSAHSTVGWGTGIIMAALCPQMQDTILKQAYDIGDSRVLGGMHWQSDVDDARTIGSACVARMIPEDMFVQQLGKSLTEFHKMMQDSLGIAPPDYDAEDYYSPNNMPDAVHILPPPPSLDSCGTAMAYEMERYIWGKMQRDTDRGRKAQFDTSNDFDVMVQEFAGAFGNRISPDFTPALYSLLQLGAEASDNACKNAQQHYKRMRPFDFFHEKAYTFEDQTEIMKEGSYPSAHASRAWTTALLLVAVSPEQQDTVFKVGYDLAESNIIAGTNWPSDIEAGRIVAGLALSRMMSNPHFLELVNRARAEYERETNVVITDEADLHVENGNMQESPMYTIDGRRARSDAKGILVSKNRKILR